jgi:hypothetical protein
MAEWLGRAIVWETKSPSAFKAKVMIPHPDEFEGLRCPITPWWGAEGVGLDFFVPSAMVESAVIEVSNKGSHWAFSLYAQGELVTTMTSEVNPDALWKARDVMLDWYHDTLAPNRRAEDREELDVEASSLPTASVVFGNTVWFLGIWVYFLTEGSSSSLPDIQAMTLGFVFVILGVMMAMFQRKITKNFYTGLMLSGLLLVPTTLILLAEILL